jgi:hypothetical protein
MTNHQRSILKKTLSLGHTREVSFDRISVRLYAMELGDNPACTIGAPVQLSWHFEDDNDNKDLDEYEAARRPRRSLRQLILNYYRRKDILKQAGYSDKEIRAAEKRVSRIQWQRRKSMPLWSRF